LTGQGALVSGAARGIGRAIALRLARDGVAIVVTFSGSALMLLGYGAYVATKGAVEQFRHVLAKELGSLNIMVNVVSPGPTNTELFNQGKSEVQRQRFAQMAALGPLGRPQDNADVVALLVSQAAGWITGQNIRANGGLI
jgi:3-oxoacyl-[acyl-carrier protein] reductase